MSTDSPIFVSFSSSNGKETPSLRRRVPKDSKKGAVKKLLKKSQDSLERVGLVGFYAKDGFSTGWGAKKGAKRKPYSNFFEKWNVFHSCFNFYPTASILAMVFK